MKAGTTSEGIRLMRTENRTTTAGAFLLLLLAAAWPALSRAQDDRAELKSAEFRNERAAQAATAADAETLAKVTSLTKTVAGYSNPCGNIVVPRILKLDLGGEMAGARAVFVPDGDGDRCWGNDLKDVTILDGSDVVVWNAITAAVAVLPGKHDGVHDLSFGGPGLSLPVWIWGAAQHQYLLLKVIDMTP